MYKGKRFYNLSAEEQWEKAGLPYSSKDGCVNCGEDVEVIMFDEFGDVFVTGYKCISCGLEMNIDGKPLNQ